ncbi:MAG: DUF374 domain-containing protein [Candidatus Hydrogenedens sp.]|nr:DUF374 domain-containing protein [Candidatus Hydrogenedens sp.]
MKLPGLVYDSPNRFTFKQRVQLALIPPAISYLYGGLASSCRWEVRNQHRMEQVIGHYGSVTLGVWHETTGMLLSLHKGRNFHSTASYSFDGELAARVCHYFGAETVRGSSSKGGSLALDQMEKAVPLVPCVGLTMDGPRGPRRVAKPGVAILAARTQRPIVPNACVVQPAWRTRSWDQFMIPKPFARVICDFGEPIPPPPSEDRDDIEFTRLQVEQSLNAITEALEVELGVSGQRALGAP